MRLVDFRIVFPAMMVLAGQLLAGELSVDDLVVGRDGMFGGSVTVVKGLSMGSPLRIAASNATYVSARGSAQITTSSPKLGTGHLVLAEGEGNYLSIMPATTNVFDFKSGDFTIDFWIYIDSSTPATKDPIWCGASDWNSVCMSISADRKVEVWGSSTGTDWDILQADNPAAGNGFQGATALSLNTYHHVAVVRSGNLWSLYLDGVVDKTNTSSGTLYNRIESRQINQWGNDYSGGMNWISGSMDEFRVSKGIARWTSNFTPPTVAYTNDAYTALLLHFDGEEGSSTITDSVSSVSGYTLPQQPGTNGQALVFDSTGSLAWSGVATAAQGAKADLALTNGASGVALSGSFSGSGAGLTGIQVTQVVGAVTAAVVTNIAQAVLQHVPEQGDLSMGAFTNGPSQ